MEGQKAGGEPVVRLSSVSFQYDGKTVLDQIDFTLHKGDFVGIVGPNGSGKSTLLKLILGLLAPQQGAVELFGQSLSRFRDWYKIGYVAQQAAHGTGGFPATVREVVMSGLTGKVGMFRRLTKEHRRQAEEVINRVGLGDKIDARIGSLSGGQRQRVFIARALVSEPELLILDEPTVGVDQESIEQFYQLLRSLKEESGLTMMIVSHDIGVMTQWVNKVACLQRQLHFHGSSDEFAHKQEQVLQRMYGESIRLLTHHH
ncbi:metal ABC transporter ATP-binding protein [Brevibacillus humidisoli]|uniref:metal ABC transporter ATP-binding protein n=1 Tax=Brevibacillus humidisoli TaxID=2895522 RepID=UPI001E38A92F|nr:metal ABC transporter ATP-binding protein [Brevibacillus humidisoli]UFJ40564.1 metal ABC transporter ATP-binding protein [Brevibacillus humidisoli]